MNGHGNSIAACRQSTLCAPEVPGRARTLPERLELVGRLDWNFKNARTQEGIHRIHPYPAKFIPQIPRQLIELLHPGDASTVLDPFCGSGTTLVEAQAAAHASVGIDLNPLAALIARVKTHPPTEEIGVVAREIVARASRLKVSIPDIPRLDHWFERAVQEALARIARGVESLCNVRTRNALKVALSSLIVRVSNQESDTRYAAVKKPRLSQQVVFDAFERAAVELDRSVSEQFDSARIDRLATARVLTRNVLDVHPAEVGSGVGLVVTSPPYPNAYEYWLYHKYRMYWLGMDPLPVRRDEIGARPHYFKTNPQTAADFEQQMGQVFCLISRVLNENGLVCFVVGRSVIHGCVIDNKALLQRAAAVHGFRLLTSVTRTIPDTRKAFNPVHGAIKREEIAVFGR